jgi:folylpolyglutamate synthase/dihydropteroate synthase
MKYNLQGFAYDTVNDALEAAKSVANPSDLIMIMGSIFVVAEVYSKN